MSFASHDDVQVCDLRTEAVTEFLNELSSKIERSSATTWSNGLEREIADFFSMKSITKPNLKTVCSTVQRVLSVAVRGDGSIEQLRDQLVMHCRSIRRHCINATQCVFSYIRPFMTDTSIILIHGSDEVLEHIVSQALYEFEGISFVVTEGRPSESGRKLLKAVNQKLEALGIGEDKSQGLHLIPDSCVASIMDDISFVLMGASSIVAHGGIVNVAGALQVAIIAHAMNTPIHVAAQSYKFQPVVPNRSIMRSTHQGQQMARFTSVGSLQDSWHYPSMHSTWNPPSPLPQFHAESLDLVPPSYVECIFSEFGRTPPASAADDFGVDALVVVVVVVLASCVWASALARFQG